jgi:putative tryptophan/tyrosine transport system substrate-binding protein
MQVGRSSRRAFIAGLGGAAVWPLIVRAQQTGSAIKSPRIGVLWHAGSAEEEEVYLSVVRKAFNDLGYIEGKNIELVHRFPAEKPDRFRALAQELVESKVDAIIAVTELGALEAKRATTTIPVVFVVVPDPVAVGLVEGLARPGGNVTGLSLMAVDLSGKSLSLLKEAVPKLSRVGLLVDPTVPTAQPFTSAYRAAAATLGLSLLPVDVPTSDAIEQAFSGFAQDGADGVVIAGSAMQFNERARIGSSALAQKLPTIVDNAEMVPYGPLLSYGQDFSDFFRRSAGYVDKILKGAKPADLPVEQPTKFKLVINLKAAKALGLSMPQTLLAQADEVIE